MDRNKDVLATDGLLFILVRNGVNMMQRLKRQTLYLLGWSLFGIGAVGLFVPLLPTTCFWIGAAWAFSKSSDRWHAYLMNHPKFGPILSHWREYGAISTRVKWIAISTMTLSFSLSIWLVQDVVWLQIALLGLYVLLTVYLISRPSHPLPVTDRVSYRLAE